MNLNDAGPGSLRAAVLAATWHLGEDTIQFRAGLAGTLTLRSTLNLVSDVRIIGPGAGQLTISGGNARRVFFIAGPWTDVTLRGLTIANGQADRGAGIFDAGASLVLSSVVVQGNRAQAGAGNEAAGGGL